MKVLLVGTGGVGESIAILAKDRPWLEHMVLADYNLPRAQEVQDKLGASQHFPVEFLDASVPSQIAALAKDYQVDLIMNAVDPMFNEQVFDVAFELGLQYMDMAMNSDCGLNLGRYQFERSPSWENKGLLALVGMGVEPGISDVFAAYAAKHLFDSIEEIGVRDGANLEVQGYEFAPNFSIWTTIEECLDPPVVYEKGRGWFTTENFSEPEMFDFPDGIGPLECVNVEHEEVLLDPAVGEMRPRDLQVRTGPTLHRRPQDPSHAGPGQHGENRRQRSACRARERRRRLPPRPGSPRRPDDRARHALGHGSRGTKDGQAARGVHLPGGGQRNNDGGNTACRRWSGRLLSAPSSQWNCWLKAYGRAPACSDPRLSTPTRSWRGWELTVLPIRSGSTGSTDAS